MEKAIIIGSGAAMEIVAERLRNTGTGAVILTSVNQIENVTPIAVTKSFVINEIPDMIAYAPSMKEEKRQAKELCKRGWRK